MAGVYVAGRCYADAAIGVDALFSSVTPAFSSTGCLVYLSKSGSWYQHLACPSESIISVQAPVPALLPCEPLDSVLDGFLLSFAVVAVWVVAWSFRILGTAFHAH